MRPRSFLASFTVALIVETPRKENSTISRPQLQPRQPETNWEKCHVFGVGSVNTEAFISGGSGLTEAALAKHNEAHKDAEDEDMLSSTPGVETGSVTANTFNTWATSYTDCTNATFSKVHRYWHSNSAQHKEVWQIFSSLLYHCVVNTLLFTITPFHNNTIILLKLFAVGNISKSR